MKIAALFLQSSSPHPAPSLILAMAILTGLSVPVFNVLKYFFIVIFIESIARGALNNIRIFLRKFDLYNGRGCLLSKSRIDRYNLLQVRGRRSFVRIFLWTLLVICYYAVEIMFEFSSDAVVQRKAHSERKLVYNPSYSACRPFDVLRSFVARRMSEMALKCVDVTDKEYILYKPLWVKEESGSAQTALCAKIPENVLQKGERIYKDRRFLEGAPSWNAVAELRSAVKEHAWTTNRNTDTALVVISVSSSHLIRSEILVPGNSKYQASIFSVRISSRPSAFCGGFISGAVGEGVTGLWLTACVDNTTAGLHYLQARGTTTVPLDVERVQNEHWTVDVVAYFSIAVRNFTKGVFNSEGDQGLVQLIAYTGFLSVATERDSASLNKYAAVYKHCNLFKIAQTWNRVQWKVVEHASAEEQIVVSLSEWGLIIVIGWSVMLWTLSRCLLSIANRKGVPNAVYGEINIARRWAAWETGPKAQCADHSRPSSPKKWIHKMLRFQSTQAYFHVEAGTVYDDIVATRNPIQFSRDTSKPFKGTSWRKSSRTPSGRLHGKGCSGKVVFVTNKTAHNLWFSIFIVFLRREL